MIASFSVVSAAFSASRKMPRLIAKTYDDATIAAGLHGWIKTAPFRRDTRRR